MTCKQCGKEFERYCNPNLLPPKYCSIQCANSVTRKTSTCQGCGANFWKRSGARDKYCSRDCVHKYRIKRPPAPRYCKVHLGQCNVCAKPMVSSRRVHTYWICSTTCKERHLNQKYVESLDRMRKRYQSQLQATTKTCVECGDEFTVTLHSERIYCTERCGKKACKRERNHRVRSRSISGKTVRFTEIWIRDRGICQLCHRPINRSLRAPDPRCASLDHITPLSRGGTHEPRNVQLAHFRCNSLRRDVGPAQLRLME